MNTKSRVRMQTLAVCPGYPGIHLQGPVVLLVAMAAPGSSVLQGDTWLENQRSKFKSFFQPSLGGSCQAGAETSSWEAKVTFNGSPVSQKTWLMARCEVSSVHCGSQGSDPPTCSCHSQPPQVQAPGIVQLPGPWGNQHRSGSALELQLE